MHVVIVGAGPAGCILARDLSRGGVKVTVIEKKQPEELGHNWSDAVERCALAEVGFDVPPPAGQNVGPLVKADGKEGIFEEHSYPQMDVWAPDYSCRKEINFRYITTDRKALAKLLLQQAEGAEFRFGCEAGELIYEGVSLDSLNVTGLRVRNCSDDSEDAVMADIVVDAGGLKAVLRTQLPAASGIAAPFTDADLAFVFRSVRRRDESINEELRDHYRYGYNTGYQWVQRLNEHEIDSGAGVRLGYEGPQPPEIVEEFISRHPSISSEVVRGGQGICLVGRSPFSLVAGGFMVVGDAAGQTIPMTGCGAGAAMVGAKLAAETILAADGRSDLAALWSYNYMWFVESRRGANGAALIAMKNILQDLSHEETSFLFRKDVLSGAMLTDSINGLFREAGARDTVKTLLGCISRPGLLLKLSRASAVGGAIYKHYLNYPKTPAGFTAWSAKSAALFGRSE